LANPTIARYQIEVPAYSGPLDLLLHLIERNELDITAISLVRVTAQYLEQVERLKEDRVDQLIDFLVIGARLVLIKSRALLPLPPAPAVGEEEAEDPAEALARQLRHYKQFKTAAAWLGRREEEGWRTYLRVVPPPKLEARLDLSGVTTATLLQAMRAVLSRTERAAESLHIAEPRTITIEGQIQRLRSGLQERPRLNFRELLSVEATGLELGVTLLAVLELIKRREVVAHQSSLFGPIEITAAEQSHESAQPVNEDIEGAAVAAGDKGLVKFVADGVEDD
jgi:segregation and condensation protein A